MLEKCILWNLEVVNFISWKFFPDRFSVFSLHHLFSINHFCPWCAKEHHNIFFLKKRSRNLNTRIKIEIISLHLDTNVKILKIEMVFLHRKRLIRYKLSLHTSWNIQPQVLQSVRWSRPLAKRCAQANVHNGTWLSLRSWFWKSNWTSATTNSYSSSWCR